MDVNDRVQVCRQEVDRTCRDDDWSMIHLFFRWNTILKISCLITLYSSLSVMELLETKFQLKVPPLDINYEKKKKVCVCVSVVGK